MKKVLLFAVLFANTVLNAHTYHFSAVAPSGQTLRYYIVGDHVEIAERHCPSGLLVIPDSVTYNDHTYIVKKIGSNAFLNCSGLTSVIIPNSVTMIGDHAFYGCSNLTSVTIGNSVTHIGYSSFEGCYNLNSITFGNSVIYILYYAFRGCTSLTSITFSNSVTDIGESAFSGCRNLTSVTFGRSLRYIDDGAFSGCSKITSINIPDSVRNIGEGAFAGCNSLTSIIVTSGNTHLDSRDNCNGIIWTNRNELICGCRTTVIPNSVTSISVKAFSSCDSLTSITIPNSVTSIGERAFAYCGGLTEITCLATTAPSQDDDVFSGVSRTIPIYIPCGSQSSYSSRWSDFSNFIETPGFRFNVQSANNTMGRITVLTRPSCSDSTAVFSATANSCYRFDHWSDGSTTNPRTLVLTQDTSITAYFVRV